MKREPKLLFDDGSAPLILEAFDCKVDNQGFIVNKSNERVLTPDNQELEVSRLGGIYKNEETGNPVFIKDDLHSIINYLDLKSEIK